MLQLGKFLYPHHTDPQPSTGPPPLGGHEAHLSLMVTFVQTPMKWLFVVFKLLVE